MTNFFSIVIVNYNLTREVRNCINSILTFQTLNNYEIIIVDNASTEEEAKSLLVTFPKTQYPQISVFYLKENRGFGAGNNFGSSKATGNILLFMNPDATFIEEIFSKVEYYILNNYLSHAFGPLIYKSTSEVELSVGRFPNLLSEVSELFFLKKYFLRKKFIEQRKHKGNKPIIVDWITGAAIIIRKNIFDEVNGFDEDYFLYNEEIDFFKRLKDKGYAASFIPSIKIKHIGSVSSKKNYFLFTKYSYESRLLYYKKHFKGIEYILLRVIFVILLIEQLFFSFFLVWFNRKKYWGKFRAFSSLIISQFKPT